MAGLIGRDPAGAVPAGANPSAAPRTAMEWEWARRRVEKKHKLRADVAAFCDTLRTTKPADPKRPVLVAGDPERRIAQQRRQNGIPVGPNLLAKVREVALASGAEWIMDK